VHGGYRFVVHADDYEKPAFPFNQDRHAYLAFAGNYGVNFPITGLPPQIGMAWALGYIDTMGYPENPGFFARRPFVPLFMPLDQV
jgi:hypothetical protein